MINVQGNELLIFENFLLDTKLPKHQGTNEQEAEGNLDSLLAETPPEDNYQLTLTRFPAHRRFNHSVIYPRVRFPEHPRLEKIFNAIYDVVKPYNKVEDIFNEIITSKQKIVENAKSGELFEEMIKNAKEGNQESYVELLEMEHYTYKLEQKLLGIGFEDYITDQQLIEVYKNSSRLMRLDWIQNFTRAIPKEVLQTKKELDEHHIFDNYVILHYDPFRTGSSQKAVSEKDAKEIEKAKDPILFGVIASSKKLYLVGDWEDEYCDLTYKKLLEMTEAEKIKYSEYQMNDGHKVEIFKND